MIRRISLSIVLLLTICMNVMAQEEDERIRDKSVSLELLGPSVLVGATYDARFKPDSKWGYRAGVGYTYLSSVGCMGGTDRQYAVMMPLGVNYIPGEGKGSLEVGAGVSLGITHDSRAGYQYDYNVGTSDAPQKIHVDVDRTSKTEFAHFFYGNIGYRHVSKNGFQFRCGISPSFYFDNKDFDFVVFWPYVSVGYAF